MTDLTIVFVNFHAKNDIVAALQSVGADLRDCPFSVQVVVVDNSQNADGMREAVIAFPFVRYLDARSNVGFGKANTLGFRAEMARYYAAFNPDIIVPDGKKTIERMIRFLDTHPKVGAIGPKLLNADGSLQYSCFRFDLLSMIIKPLKQVNLDARYPFIRKHVDRLLMKEFHHNETRPVDWVIGAALIVRREAVEQVGWFDERYFLYFEDCDWCRELWEHHWPVYYVHDIVMYHRHARTSATIPGLLRALVKNKLARIHLVSWVKYLWKWRHTHHYYQ